MTTECTGQKKHKNYNIHITLSSKPIETGHSGYVTGHARPHPHPTVLVIIEDLRRGSSGVTRQGPHLVPHISTHRDVDQLELDVLTL